MSIHPPGAGKSSLDLVDQGKAIALIDARPGSVFLDLACGFGRYSLLLADIVGPDGTVYAVDLWSEGLDQLRDEAILNRKTNIVPIRTDMGELPLAQGSVDCVLLATALHDVPEGRRQAVVREIARVLKPGGAICVIEFKIKNKGPGPPAGIRLADHQVADLFIPLGFKVVQEEDLGDSLYGMRFVRTPDKEDN